MIYEIGPFRLDAEAAVVTRAGVPVALGSRGVAVLTTLVERSNEFVQKGAIMDAAWRRRGQKAISGADFAIRRVLAQEPEASAGSRRWQGGVIGLWGRSPSAGRPTSFLRHKRKICRPLTSFIGRERELVEIRLLPGGAC